MAEDGVTVCRNIARKFDGIKITSDAPPVRRMLNRWGHRFLGFLHDRYEKYSRGGGDWPDLAPSTKRHRKKARKGHRGPRKFAILIEYEILIGSLQVGSPGNILTVGRDSVTAGIGGSARYSQGKRTRGGLPTIRDIANFHQQGRGNNPVRKIVVEPDRRCTRDMKRYGLEAVNEMLRF